MTVNEEIVCQFIMKGPTFKLKQQLQTPLYLDTVNYKYYVKLLQCQFSNVIPNITSNLYVDSQLVVVPGVYELTDLVNAYNKYKTTYGELTIDENIGRLKLSNLTPLNMTITSSSFLSNQALGKFSLPIHLGPFGSVYSSTVPVIQDYNYFVLTCENVVGNTYSQDDFGSFEVSNIVYNFSSAIKPFRLKTWTAVQPVAFRIDQQSLQYMAFELKDGNGHSLDNIIGQSDFCITAQIVKIKKI